MGFGRRSQARQVRQPGKSRRQDHGSAPQDADSGRSPQHRQGRRMVTRIRQSKEARMRYFAILDGKPGAFGVSFPDLPGCVAMGKDENDAYANALDALSEWVHDARMDGDAPNPRP